MYQSHIKRWLDGTLAAVALVALSPLMLLVGLAILLEDGRPVLFKQSRVGRRGETFTLFKFRSMARNTSEVPSDQAAPLHVTRVGGIIRRANIDELPQLYNVLQGTMSIVGPRPALPQQEELNNLRRRNGSQRLRPGLTGLAQIRAFDGMTPERKAKYDAEYLDRLGLLFDICIILRTFGYLVRRPPVY